MVYVGLSYYGPSLDTNAYLSFFLSAVVEIPSYLGCWVVMDRWGRRWPLCLCMVISGICCIATVLIPPGFPPPLFSLNIIHRVFVKRLPLKKFYSRLYYFDIGFISRIEIGNFRFLSHNLSICRRTLSDAIERNRNRYFRLRRRIRINNHPFY